MIAILRSFVKSIPTLILSVALAVAVWISAVTASDPISQRLYPRPVTIERAGLDPALVISGDVPAQASFTLSAPSTIWDRMLSDRAPVRAWINLAGLGAGTHTVDIKYQLLIQPSKVVTYSPRNVTVTLEKLVTQEFPIHLITRGEPAVGFQADQSKLSQEKVSVSGPSSQVEKVRDIRVTLDLTQAADNINRTLDVQLLDANETPVEGLTVVPAAITVTQPISQRGGYRNVVVKVASSGQVASGYRLTNISVFPPTVTVFSTNPQLVERLPGFVETSPIDLTGVKDDIDLRLPLNLPNGIEVVGDQSVLVQVGVAAIEGSVTFTSLPIEVEGLPAESNVRISPETVDVIISGPVPILDRLVEEDVRVYLDLTGASEGTYQFAPRVQLSIPELKVESILPSSIEVVVEPKGRGTPTPTPTVTPFSVSNPQATPTATKPRP